MPKMNILAGELSKRYLKYVVGLVSYNTCMKRTTIQHFWELLWEMTEKELRARYKHTVFGFLWVVANPLLQMFVIGFVFTFFMKVRLEHYYHYLFTGLLVWSFFSLSLSKTTPSIVLERSLIKKAKFPHAVIPLSIIVSNLIHMLAAFLMFLVPLSIIETLSISRLPYLLLGFMFLLMFTIGTSLLTSALNVRYRDVNFFVQALLIIWFYATPIIYSFSIVPQRFSWLWHLNPMTSILQLFQHAFVNYSLPSLPILLTNGALIVLVFYLGAKMFNKESKNFDDWL